MRIGFCRVVWLLVTFMAGSSVLSGAQSPATKGSAGLEGVKERTADYYRDILADNLDGAQQLVAPESKNDFFHMSYIGLIDFRIVDASLSEKGDEATVIVTWIQKPPQFPKTVNHDVRNTWKRIDGQWYIVLPSPKELQTPFGTMALGAKAKPSGEATALQQTIQQRQADVDEDQYLLALQKAAQKANAAKAEEKKSSETKSQDDKAKPEPQPQPQN
jgi:hypothetical protein